MWQKRRKKVWPHGSAHIVCSVTFCDSTLNTANLCPAISVVGLFYLLTYCDYEFCVSVYFRRRFHQKVPVLHVCLVGW